MPPKIHQSGLTREEPAWTTFKATRVNAVKLLTGVTITRRCWAAAMLLSLSTCGVSASSPDDLIWIEGEHPTDSRITRHPWYSAVDQAQFSGRDLLSHFNDDEIGEATYRFECPRAGDYELWIRTNPVMSALTYSLNGSQATAVDFQKGKRDEINVAADGKPDLRFLAWVKIGSVPLTAGTNSIQFRLTSAKHHHGYLDCFVFSPTSILPRGPTMPLAFSGAVTDGPAGWFSFEPASDPFAAGSIIDLRFLNEETAGDGGQIIARDGRFFHSRTSEPVRFWSVNGPPEDLHGDDLNRCARMLAKYGVNLVRIHGAVFDKRGEPDIAKVRKVHEVVRAMKAAGIYTHLSIYFPLWFQPPADLDWMPGYNGKQNPFAALFINPRFQEKHREWIRVLLTTPDDVTGQRLVDEPAVFGLELQNEDSLFFWTFTEANVPDPQLQILERRFGDWLVQRAGSMEAALANWNAPPLPRDNLSKGRIAFRPIWNLFNDRTRRDQDTVAFLLEVQTSFYQTTTDYCRDLGFKGLVHASNWTTASPERLTPLEKLSYLTGDFIDRHGYFECNHQGENAAWSIRNDHTFSHRSALRFDGRKPGEPKLFTHPVMDPQYNDKPSMISETTFTRPNRYRSEAPLYYAAYGALQDSDAIVHFAFDGAQWEVKPRFWMQQWTLATPSMLTQFPAAALIYRRGLIAVGDVLATVQLNRADLLALQGSPLPQDASFDELRLKDVPSGSHVSLGQRIDPLIHYAGRTQVTFSDEPSSTTMTDLAPLIDRASQTVTSSSGEVSLNYGSGLMKIAATKVQGASGDLNSESAISLPAVRITSSMDLAHMVAVSLDDKPLQSSDRILLQIMSEERTTGFEAQPTASNEYRISDIGTDPWQIKQINGTIELLRPDANQLSVRPLDLNGYPQAQLGTAERIELLPNTLYYLISRASR